MAANEDEHVSESIRLVAQARVRNDDQAGPVDVREREYVRLVQALLADGQRHIFDAWEDRGDDGGASMKRRMLDQLCKLDENYSDGGLLGYIGNARRLLDQSKRGLNPLEGWIPSVPSGEVLTLNVNGVEDARLHRFIELQNSGIQEAGKSAFVLVAGGLGERLGFSDIKVKLPAETVTGKSFLETYIKNILSLQKHSNTRGQDVKLPLAIMTSDDTHKQTQRFLKLNNYFGMDDDSVTLLKQEKVACLANNDAHLALNPSKDGDSFEIMTKPHGHGDVHALLFKSGLLEKWIRMGLAWVCFFQDTNGLVFNAIPPALGVSKENSFEVNSLAVPRMAKEAIGGIAKLKNASGDEMTLNLEYNQLDPILRATVNPEGDVNDTTSGFSPFPGNINQLIFHLEGYHKTLQRTKGYIPEFVNPKYVDVTSKSEFKSPTRLECMMQDYPRSLPSSSLVGFTVTDVWYAYSPVKNSPSDAVKKTKSGTPSHSATSGELDIYRSNSKILSLLGASIGDPVSTCFNGLTVDVYPRIVWDSSFALSINDLKICFPFPERVSISSHSTLVLSGEGIIIESLALDGALLIETTQSDISVRVSGLKVENAGWQLEAINEEIEDETINLRGFTIRKNAARRETFDKPGNYTLSN